MPLQDLGQGGPVEFHGLGLARGQGEEGEDAGEEEQDPGRPLVAGIAEAQQQEDGAEGPQGDGEMHQLVVQVLGPVLFQLGQGLQDDHGLFHGRIGRGARLGHARLGGGGGLVGFRLHLAARLHDRRLGRLSPGRHRCLGFTRRLGGVLLGVVGHQRAGQEPVQDQKLLHR